MREHRLMTRKHVGLQILRAVHLRQDARARHVCDGALETAALKVDGGGRKGAATVVFSCKQNTVQLDLPRSVRKDNGFTQDEKVSGSNRLPTAWALRLLARQLGKDTHGPPPLLLDT
jgi:hypothetical protein